MKKEIILRKDVDETRTWDLSAIYKSEEEFLKDVSKLNELVSHVVENCLS